MHQVGLVLREEAPNVLAFPVVRCQENDPLEPTWAALQFFQTPTHFFVGQSSRLDLRLESKATVPTAEFGVREVDASKDAHLENTVNSSLRRKVKEIVQERRDEPRTFVSRDSEQG